MKGFRPAESSRPMIWRSHRLTVCWELGVSAARSGYTDLTLTPRFGPEHATRAPVLFLSSPATRKREAGGFHGELIPASRHKHAETGPIQHAQTRCRAGLSWVKHTIKSKSARRPFRLVKSFSRNCHVPNYQQGAGFRKTLARRPLTPPRDAKGRQPIISTPHSSDCTCGGDREFVPSSVFPFRFSKAKPFL